MLRHIFVIISLFCALGIQAQNDQFLDNLKKKEDGKAKVTVTQSSDIDALVNGKGNRQKKDTQNDVQQQPAQGGTGTGAGTAAKPSGNGAGTGTGTGTAAKPAGSTAGTAGAGARGANPANPNANKKVLKPGTKTIGYRIQVFSGGNTRVDKQNAEKAGADMKRLFPSEPVYVHFYSPSWKCRMGNYLTVEDARKVLAVVKKSYPQACMVKGTITAQ